MAGDALRRVHGTNGHVSLVHDFYHQVWARHAGRKPWNWVARYKHLL